MADEEKSRGTSSVNGVDRKARLKREAEALPLAFGAVIRYQRLWLIVLFVAFVVPWGVKGFAEWVLPVSPWMMGAIGVFSLACWLGGLAVVFVLIAKVSRFQKRLVARECLSCGYPLPEGVGKRCSECGKFAEIALAPEE